MSAVAGRVQTRLDLCNYLAGFHEFIAETVKFKLTVETLKAFAELSAWQFKQYTLAARVCQRQLNIKMKPAVAGAVILAEPISSAVLELEAAARQSEFALQSARRVRDGKGLQFPTAELRLALAFLVSASSFVQIS